MSDTYYYFECVNGACSSGAVVDVRVKDSDKPRPSMRCPVCADSMDYRGCAAADADGYSVKWETVVDDRNQSVRRLRVPTGWIYQIQNGRGYNSIAGTIGRQEDRGYPTWGPLVFVPNDKALL